MQAVLAPEMLCEGCITKLIVRKMKWELAIELYFKV